MTALLVSALVVAIAEIGDKTQLLAIVLATRFNKPVPIVLGIVCATLLNHLLAATGGYFLANFLEGNWFRYLIAASFIAVAAWTLLPGKIAEAPAGSDRGAFLTTLISYFFIETGDKTQIATIALAARFHSIVLVTAGTTLGVALADGAAIFLAGKAIQRLPMNTVRAAAAALFLTLGIWTFADAIQI